MALVTSHKIVEEILGVLEEVPGEALFLVKFCGSSARVWCSSDVVAKGLKNLDPVREYAKQSGKRQFLLSSFVLHVDLAIEISIHVIFYHRGQMPRDDYALS